MKDGADSFARSRERTDAFHHGDRHLLLLIGTLGLLFALVVAGALIGPGFDPDSNDPLWALLAGLVLAGLHAARLPLADL
ncbi:MAG TPA: hypothetical protein VMM55_13890, partial [Thermohalobaculum sp.]|nr:hypothetical protein [Thermohalobaculum sp.]